MADNKEEKEIDLLELIHKLWDNKKFILKVTIIGAFIGLIIAFSIPKEYTSTVVFTTMSNDAKIGNMGSLASLAGINLGNLQSSDIISSELYPNIITSTPFIQDLLNVNVKDYEQEIDTTLYSYLENDQKAAWWNYILNAPRLFIDVLKSDDEQKGDADKRSSFISKEEMKVIKVLKESYNINTDKKTGLTTIEITSQSAKISAFLADTITLYLQEYIIAERTRKAKIDLENTIKLYDQSKIAYDTTQRKLATFLDRNKNITSARYEINQKKLENEANLAYSVYSQMAQQVQINKVKVQDDTPVFAIIQPAIEPIYPDTSKVKIVIIFTLICVVCVALWLLRHEIKALVFDEKK